MSAQAKSELPEWCTSLLPAHIFWRYHIEDKRLILLSPGVKPGFAEILPTLLTDLRFAASIVATDDFPRFKYFIKHLRQGSSDQILFRLTSQLGQWRSGQMAFHASEKNPSVLHGYFLDITELIASGNIPKGSPRSVPPALEEAGHKYAYALPLRQDDLPGTLQELCRQQQENQSSLFDSLALIRFEEDQSNKKWHSYGFEGDPPNQNEIDHLILYLKKTLDRPGSRPLIVNNTVSSSQPLDWAIFVRGGLISYWIEPLTHRRKLKGAIIFASRQAWRYHPDLQTHLHSAIESLKSFL